MYASHRALSIMKLHLFFLSLSLDNATNYSIAKGSRVRADRREVVPGKLRLRRYVVSGAVAVYPEGKLYAPAKNRFF